MHTRVLATFAVLSLAAGVYGQSLTQPIETSNRAAVRNAYNRYFTEPMPAMQWTGSLASCSAGTIAAAFQDWTLTRVNFFRAMTGLPGNVVLNATNSAKAQKAALMFAANQQLSHFPPTTWTCYSAEGAEAAANSNIAISFGPSTYDDVVPRYVDDEGSNNAGVGHRRWILFPPQVSVGVGSLPTSFQQWGSNALWVLGPFGSRPATPAGTPWPPRGFVPLALFPTSRRWSFSYPDADFTASTVTMSANGAPVPLTVLPVENGFGDNTIVWEPTLTVAKSGVYDVAITGVAGTGVPTSFTYTVRPFDPADPYVARADFAGDGLGDILWRNTATGENAIWQMNGISIASAAFIPGVSDVAWRIVGTGDFDGDGRSDILWRHATTGQNAIWTMNGFTVTSGAFLFSVADPAWIIAAIADFDADGKSDILWRNASTGENAIWLMNGTTISSSAFIDAVPDPNWTIAGAADLSGDGMADIVWRNTSTGDVAVWLMRNFAATSTAVVQAVPTAWAIAGLGDYDGDGKSDLLWRNGVTGENAIWLMSGLTRKASALINQVPASSWIIVGAADYDGDGKADVLWRNSSTGDNAIWLMNGFTMKNAALIPAVPTTSWAVVRQ